MKRINTVAGKDFTPNRAEKMQLSRANLTVEPILTESGYVSILYKDNLVGEVLPNSGQLVGFAYGWIRKGEVG